MDNTHEAFMRIALEEARKAARRDEVPVGAVLVRNGKVIAKGRNCRENKKDPLGHAEIVAIRKGARRLGGWRLVGCTLYVTLEPCPMCMGAIINARIPAVVYGARDPKAGAAGSLYDLNEGKLNHTTDMTEGILREECSMILKEYFAAKRRKKK